MKISVDDDTGWLTSVLATDRESENTIEVSDDEWSEFRDVEEHYEKLVEGFRQRRDAQKRAAEGELAQLRARLSQLEARVGVAKAPAPVAAKPTKPHNPVSETDWGQGISGGREKPQDPADFRAELADLRDRTTEKRAKRGAP